MEKALAPDIANKPADQASWLSEGFMLQSRYRVVRQLGTGGMGAVYEAVDERLQTTVAIKETFSVDERLRRQFEQEARLLAQLHHPSLPRVSDYFTEDGRAFLVMQFISGDDLAQIIAKQPGPFPRHQVIAWADQLLDALIYLHTRDRQIIHRDIKPHNLKLTATGQIALLDFGLAKAHTNDVTGGSSSHSIFGYTRRYSPLEQIQDLGTTPQSDIYALGATLYHLLTGVKPPDSLARAAALAHSKPDPLVPACELHPAVGAELSSMLNKALALSAVDRYQSATEFREALRLVGRVEAQAENISRSAAQSRSEISITTVARKAPTVDPFESYSILKPESEFFRFAKSRRGPAVFAVILAIGLITIAIAFPSRFLDSAMRMAEGPPTKATREVLNSTAVRPTKIETASATRSVASGSSGEAFRRSESSKRRNRRSENNRSKLATPKPPRISLAP